MPMPSISHMPIDAATERGHCADQEWSIPLSVTLPVSLVISLSLWAGLAFAAKSLFF